MTRKEAEKEFKEHILPSLRLTDKPSIRQAGNDFVDELHRDGRITDKQANSWVIPSSKLRGE